MSVTSAAQSIVQALLAALGPTQNQRLLRLHTPLGPNVLLAERLLGCESVGPTHGTDAPAGFKFEVLALSTNAHLSLKDLIGQPVRLDLLTQLSATALRPFHGHVTAFALLGSDGGLARYKLTVEPWLSFLGHRQDAWVFQGQTVMQIVDEVFADYQGQGPLAPAWRWDLADPAAYPQRSLCIQYHETDLQFVQRLLREEGLFCWFEHEADTSDALGKHTLVIADHNGAFQPNAQSRVRYTQSAAASFREDSLSRFGEAHRMATSALQAASWDHRRVQQASAAIPGDTRLSAEGLELTVRDQPGAYAYEDSTQAQRIAQRQLEAIQASAHQAQAQGAWRQAACGTTFTLAEHPSADPSVNWAVLTVQHRARNNLTADLSTALKSLLGDLPGPFAPKTEAAADATPRAPRPSLFRGPANATEEPLYQARLLVQDASVAVRPPARLNAQGEPLFTRPQVPGTQSAIVVGLGEPVHTDRDLRIKVQFHWQRGAQSAHRLDHVAGSNAPGDDSTGTWVRVSQSWAGANWGGHFTPRLGQEVLVAFVEGDIDRPVVIGSVYNGVGRQDAQGNQVAAGAATSTGNAGAWFPGNQKAGELEGHQHPAVLSGFKSQSLDTSQNGSGGHNQLVFDDTPAQARTTLGSTQAKTWLHLGHLLKQTDNQRLNKRGHGLDLFTTAFGAVRAGSGLHLSAYARSNGTQGSGQNAEARDAMAQIELACELSQTLADTAQKHNAKLVGEPEPQQLAAHLGAQALIESLRGTDVRNAALARDDADYADVGQPARPHSPTSPNAPATAAPITSTAPAGADGGRTGASTAPSARAPAQPKTPADAPQTVDMSSMQPEFDKLWNSSFPAGMAQEHGGTLVSDASGSLAIVNQAGGTTGSFAPNLTVAEGQKVEGIFHTHPYDATEGGHTGVSFSGGDAAYLINQQHSFIIAQSGAEQFMYLRTAETPPSAGYQRLSNLQNNRVGQLMAQGQDFSAASKIAARETAEIYGLAYYEGTGGVFNRVWP